MDRHQNCFPSSFLIRGAHLLGNQNHYVYNINKIIHDASSSNTELGQIQVRSHSNTAQKAETESNSH